MTSPGRALPIPPACGRRSAWPNNWPKPKLDDVPDHERDDVAEHSADANSGRRVHHVAPPGELLAFPQDGQLLFRLDFGPQNQSNLLKPQKPHSLLAL